MVVDPLPAEFTLVWGAMGELRGVGADTPPFPETGEVWLIGEGIGVTVGLGVGVAGVAIG